MAFVKRTIQVVLTAIIGSQISLDYFGIHPGFNRYALSPEPLPHHRDTYLCKPLLQLFQVTYLFLTIDPDNEENPDAWEQDLLSF